MAHQLEGLRLERASRARGAGGVAPSPPRPGPARSTSAPRGAVTSRWIKLLVMTRLACLPLRSALAWGATFTLAYLGVALYTELDANTLTSTIRLETIATHLMVPLLVVLALAYAAEVLASARSASAPSGWPSRASASGSRGICTTPPSSACTRPISW